MAKFLCLLWVLPSPYDDNISYILLTLPGYKYKAAEHAAGEILSLLGEFLSYSIISCKRLIPDVDIQKNKIPRFFCFFFFLVCSGGKKKS